MMSIDTPRPFYDHLKEFRKRLLIFCSAWGGGIAIACFFSDKLLSFLLIPFEKITSLSSHSISFFSLPEAFTTSLKLSIWGGFALSLPVLMFQLWRFIAPGLTPQEQKTLRPFLIMAPFLFICGALFAYFLIIPLAWTFFLSFENNVLPVPLLLQARLSDYVSLTLSFLISFGLSFEFPLVLIALGYLGFISSRHLALNRKYAIILIFIVAALLTPPDVLSQILLALPLMLLYEGSIWALRRHERLTLKNAKEYV